MNGAALLLVLLAGSYLVVFAAACVFFPERAKQLLTSLAGSAFAHFAEIGVRIILGTAIVYYAPQMQFAGVFLLIGWVLIVSSAVLAVLPWKWHQRFARTTVPHALLHLRLLAVGALAGGVFIIASVVLGPQ